MCEDGNFQRLKLKSLMDPILVYGRCILKIICTRKIFTNPCWEEVGYYDHGVVEAQGSLGLRVDPIDAVKKRGVQHHQGENDVRPIEGIVEYVRKTVSYEQSVFDVEVVRSTNV